MEPESSTGMSVCVGNVAGSAMLGSAIPFITLWKPTWFHFGDAG